MGRAESLCSDARSAEKGSFAPSLQKGKNIQNRTKPPNPLPMHPTDWTDKILPRAFTNPCSYHKVVTHGRQLGPTDDVQQCQCKGTTAKWGQTSLPTLLSPSTPPLYTSPRTCFLKVCSHKVRDGTGAALPIDAIGDCVPPPLPPWGEKRCSVPIPHLVQGSQGASVSTWTHLTPTVHPCSETTQLTKPTCIPPSDGCVGALLDETNSVLISSRLRAQQ